MIYGGDLMSNFAGSVQSGDAKMTKSVIISKLAKVIENEPKELINALKESGVSIDEKTSVSNLIDKSISSLYENEKFREEVAKLLVSDYSNAAGLVVGAVSETLGQVFGMINSSQDRKAQEESDKRRLQMQLLQGDDKKTNWLPIVIISGVLLIGGIVAYVSLKKK
jgi:hypothetical protein